MISSFRFTDKQLIISRYLQVNKYEECYDICHITLVCVKGEERNKQTKYLSLLLKYDPKIFLKKIRNKMMNYIGWCVLGDKQFYLDLASSSLLSSIRGSQGRKSFFLNFLLFYTLLRKKFLNF